MAGDENLVNSVALHVNLDKVSAMAGKRMMMAMRTFQEVRWSTPSARKARG